MPLTQQEKQLASILPRVTALVSWLGSLSIAVDVLRKHRRKGDSDSKPTTYHGLMLGMSLFEMCISGGHAMTTLPVPSDTPDVYAAKGSEASCRTQAVFVQLGIGAVFYNLCLSIYYYLFIVKNKRPSRALERGMHLVCVSFAFGTTAASLALGLFGYAGFWCWITGDHDFYRWMFWYGPMWVVILCIAAIMAAIYYHMARQERRQQRWAIMPHANVLPPANDDSEGGTRRPSKKMTLGEALRTIKNNSRASPRSARASDNVKRQAFWYVGSFLLTWFFLTVVRGMQAVCRGDAIPAWIVLAAVSLVPSQGFFNFLIYIRPRYARHREEHPEVGRLVAFVWVNPLFVSCKCRRAGGLSVSSLSSRIAIGLSGLRRTSTPTEAGGSSASNSQEEVDEGAKDAEVICTKETMDLRVMCNTDARDIGEF